MHTRITAELPVRHPVRPTTLFVAPIAAATLGVPEEEFHTRILPRLTQNDFSDHNAISNSPTGSCDPVRQQCPLPGPLTTFQPTVETWADRAAVRRFEGDSLDSAQSSEAACAQPYFYFKTVNSFASTRTVCPLAALCAR